MSARLPLLNERIYAPYKIEMLVETLAEQGIAPEDALRGSGLGAEEIHNPDRLTSVRQYLSVCRNAVRLSRDPATPFKVGSKMHLSAYGMYGYALMCSVTIRDFFNLGVKYHKLATPTLTIQWREQPDAAVWVFPDAFITGPSRELKEFLIEQQFAQHVIHLKDVAGRDTAAIKACFAYPAPPHATIYEEHLGCRCFFDQNECELYYPASILDQRPQLAHRLTSTLLQETCDRLIGETKTSSGTAGEVYQLLMCTPGHFPSMEEAADVLSMTPRTLRRHLESEGTTFAQISDDVRCSLATEYLRTTKLSTDDIASLVGFSETSNFRRAFKRWTGKAPSDFR
ncbi:AraC family transcriptional regulator [Paraburkholderia bengalensis]|uniref:AraC family transcriptional regulator n=1 Tax=Paraburkholderia bengalensis TaxID=2747562 RepID=A0ABU8IK95_9BURK